MEALQMEIVNILVIVIAGVLGLIAKQVTSFLKKKGLVAQLESHKEIGKIIVGAIEQAYKPLHGEEKLNLAKIELIKFAKEKGLKISERELDLIIESSVREMKKAVKEELKK